VLVRAADVASHINDISEGMPAVQTRPGQRAKLQRIPPDWPRKTRQGPGSFGTLRTGNPLEQIVAISENCSQNLLRAC
jgi:hypothetical protein